MSRLTRAEMQEHNRAKVLAAAQEEFADRGFRDTKIDDIAARAGLTRGAVYSNFPGKRALYFAVLAELTERSVQAPPGTASPAQAGDATDTTDSVGALAEFARGWLARLPLATEDRHRATRLGMDLMPEIAAEEHTRAPFAQLMKLSALLLGLALERMRPPAAPAVRQVRVAEAALTTLQGVNQMAAAAPGFVEPFDIVGVCAGLAALDLGDEWNPPHLPYVPPARPVDEPWPPPAAVKAVDTVRGEAAALEDDGVVAVLGLHRLAAIEEAVRAVPPGGEVTAVLVTGDPGELGPLARLCVAELCDCLRQAFPRPAWPLLRVVHDDAGALAATMGVSAVSDATEVALRVRDGRVIARADGHGACHAAASAAD